jgi:hypothetical protein
VREMERMGWRGELDEYERELINGRCADGK